MNKKIIKVLVGLSGGVDSAVSALLLKQQGLEVIGAFMQNWQIDQDDPYCTAEQDLSDARAVADHIGIPLQVINFAKKDSTGICFIGERKFKDFLSEYLLDQPGEIKTPDGKIVGQHDGLMFYTIGQRKGLRIGGQKEAAEAPWYVIKKEFATNTLIVAQEAQLDLLYHNALICDQLHWVSEKIPHETFKATAKIRYRQSDQTCTITPRSADRWHVAFEQKQRAITPGQAIVFYQNEICLGGGTIIEATS